MKEMVDEELQYHHKQIYLFQYFLNRFLDIVSMK